MIISSESLSKGDRILVKKVTSTATGNESSSRDTSGFPGGDFPGGSFDLGNFDFGGSGFPGGGSFDPSNRPSGGPSGYGG